MWLRVCFVPPFWDEFVFGDVITKWLAGEVYCVYITMS